ncbi:hypothetical protein G9A89_019429 [Geosiphon pyriformis]|nr:hypothetical protein G9A89_019429 [Geosiphon pyriformis]
MSVLLFVIVLECPFRKVVLDHLVSDGGLILDSVEIKNKVDSIIESWTRKRAMLKSVPNLWQCQYLPLDYVDNNAFLDVMNAINLDDLTCVIKNLPNGLLLDLLNICLSPIFAIGSVVEYTLKKDHELWLVLQDMHKAYDSVVMTDFGLMDGYWVHDSLDQSEVKRQKSLCGYQIDTKFVAKTGRIENQSSLTFFLAAGVFVDDTIWMESTSKFFKINNISINNEKTVAILINQKVSNTSLLISGLPISIACRKKSHQYLGIYLSSEELSKPSLAKVHMDVRFFVNLVFKKAILDKQFLYLVSAVLDFPNEALYHSFLYDLRSFEQLQTECKVASVLCFLNADGILGHLLRVSPVNNFLAKVIRIFLDCGMFLGNFFVSAFQFSGRTPISVVLDASLFYDVSLSLRKFGITFAEQLYTKKGLIFNWKSFCHWKRLDSRGPVPHWFTLICSQDIDVCSLGAVFGLSHCFFSANMRVVNLCEMKYDAAAYFLDLHMSIGAKIGGLVSSTMAKLQTIALALECVPPDSSVVVYSDSQAVLDACVAESALVSLDFCVVGNECADKLAGLTVNSSLVLSVLVKEKFIMATRKAVSENVHYFAHEIFRSINQVCWESILKSHLAKWQSVSGLDLRVSYVLQVLSLYTSDDVLYTTVGKDFVFRDWV